MEIERYTRKGKIHTLLLILIKWIDKDRKMIRLSKDRVLEDFFIDDNGIITNKEGEVQQFNLQQNRLRFKGVQVHKIQMWTKYGWRDTKTWAIHHLNEKPFDNRLENLVYLTRSEHTALHNKGRCNGMTGKKHSLATKKKMSKSQKCLRWFNDGVKNYFIPPQDALPHYQKGRLICKK